MLKDLLGFWTRDSQLRNGDSKAVSLLQLPNYLDIFEHPKCERPRLVKAQILSPQNEGYYTCFLRFYQNCLASC